MRNSECESTVHDDSDCVTTEREIAFLDDELLLDDDRFFSALEALVAHGTGALVMVR